MKTRTEWRTREVPHSEAGETRLIPEEYPVEVPVPPRDWDHIVLNGVTAIAIGLTAVSVAWSTVSGGALLDRAAPAAAAYPAALVYDAAWITCMALEWLARYDPDRARPPRIAGYVALAIVMGAIATHGYLDAGKAVGVAGAAISAIAKGLWQLVLNHTAQPLPARTQAWLNVRRGELGAQLALAAQQRQLTRMQERHAALAAAYGQPAPDSPDTDEDTEPGQQDSLSGPARRMILARAQSFPDATPEEIAEHLAGHGITVAPDTVQAVLGDVVRQLRPRGGWGISDSVRAAIADGPADRDSVVDRVQAQHPTAKRDDIRRTYDRIIKRMGAS